MINLQPTLVGRLLTMRPLLMTDFEELYRCASDKAIWAQHPDPKRCQRQNFKNGFFNGGIQCRGCLVALNPAGKIIGSSRYYDYRPNTKDICIGYTFLQPAYWGSAFNRDMKHIMMTHIYQWVDNIFFFVGENNIRSRAAMTKIGGKLLTPQMQKERQIQQISIKNKVIFQIKKEDFKGFY